jgi:hypothetical protein
MEIKEVWMEFKERINSPFFGSFVISWLLFNWRTPVVLLFYKYEDLIRAKTTFIDVIQRYSGWWVSLIIPAFSALVYIFCHPHFKRFINKYIAEQTKITDKALLDITDSHTVSMEKFLNTKAALKKKENDLHVLINEEEEIKHKNIQLNAQIRTLQDNIDVLSNDHASTLANQRKMGEDRISDLKTSYDDRVRNLLKDAREREDNINSTFDRKLETKDIENNELRKAFDLQREMLERNNAKLIEIDKQISHSIIVEDRLREEAKILEKRLNDLSKNKVLLENSRKDSIIQNKRIKYVIIEVIDEISSLMKLVKSNPNGYNSTLELRLQKMLDVLQSNLNNEYKIEIKTET